MKIKKKALELTYQHLWIRKDGSKIIDSCEVLEDYKCRKCVKSRKKKWENLWYIAQNATQNYLRRKICNDYRRKKDERHKKVNSKMNGPGMAI